MKLVLNSCEINTAIQTYIGTMGFGSDANIEVVVVNNGKRLSKLSANVDITPAGTEPCVEASGQLDLPLDDAQPESTEPVTLTEDVVTIPVEDPAVVVTTDPDDNDQMFT